MYYALCEILAAVEGECNRGFRGRISSVSMLCAQQAQSNRKVNAHERGKNSSDTSIFVHPYDGQKSLILSTFKAHRVVPAMGPALPLVLVLASRPGTG